jgi:hypothetical protein
MGSYDPYANFAYAMTGINPAFTQNLMNVGFVGAPFSSPQQTFDQQAQYMHVLKNVLDTQLKAFNNGNNTAAMPFNMRSLFNASANVLEDPMYGIIGAPGMFNNGYAMGDLPNNGSLAGAGYWNAAHGYPGVPSPNYAFGSLGAGGGSYGGQGQGAGGSGNNTLVQSYNVPLAGGGSMTVNANSPGAAFENAKQGNNTPDPAGNISRVGA